jgi:hypothetical protein
MKSWILAAGLFAAVAAPPALAADMDDGSIPYPRGGIYDDPRYPPKPYPQQAEDDDDDDGPGARNDYPRGGVPDKYARVPPYRSNCVRSDEVRERLTSRGWRDFHAGKPVDETIVTLRARRPNGRLFELTLHRCTGRIVEVRALEPRTYDYGYRGPAEPYGQWSPGPYSHYGRFTAPWFYGRIVPPWFERPYYAYRWPPRWYRDRDRDDD